MDVIGHEHVRVNVTAKLPRGAAEAPEVKLGIGPDGEDGTAVVTALNDVLRLTGNLMSRLV